MPTVRLVLARVHLAAAALALLFLAALAVNAVSSGFTPTRDSYPPAVIQPEKVLDQLRKRILEEGTAQERVITVLGLATQPGSSESAGSAGVVIANGLADLGVSVRASDPTALESAREELDAAVELFADPYDAAEGSDAILLASAADAYRELDFERLGQRVRNRLIFDGPMRLDGDAAEQAGFQYLNAGRAWWPAWLDPELRVFADELAQQVPGKATPRQPAMNGLLLFPKTFSTFNPRGRWYLFLNYHLLPRRLYLIRPELANGTIGQFQEWITYSMQEAGLSGEKLVREARRTRAAWLLEYVQWVDFRRKDFELKPLLR